MAPAQGRRKEGENLQGKHRQTARALVMGTSHFYGGDLPLALGDSHRSGQPEKQGQGWTF